MSICRAVFLLESPSLPHDRTNVEQQFVLQDFTSIHHESEQRRTEEKPAPGKQRSADHLRSSAPIASAQIQGADSQEAAV